MLTNAVPLSCHRDRDVPGQGLVFMPEASPKSFHWGQHGGQYSRHQSQLYRGNEPGRRLPASMAQPACSPATDNDTSGA